MPGLNRGTVTGRAVESASGRAPLDPESAGAAADEDPPWRGTGVFRSTVRLMRRFAGASGLFLRSGRVSA
jgi:hypothetical protein